MRVLQLIGSTGFYGAEAVVTTLARTLPTLGIRTCIGHMRYSTKRSVFRLEDHIWGCEVIPLEHHGRMDFGFVQRLQAEMHRLSIDAIHSHGYKPDFYGGIAAKLAGVPMLSTCHLWTRSTRALRGYACLDAFLLRRFDRVVAVSQVILDELRASGVDEEKLALVPNGISAERFAAARPLFRAKLGKDALIFGAACRQVSAKGVDLLLRAAADVTARFPHARFLIAGDGPKLDEYRLLAHQLGIDTRVTFLGRCDAMPEFYASLDIFVLPSLDEGMPIALLEAMAAGRPVIATDVGSVKSVVCNGANGLLIPSGDIEELTRAMISLGDSRERMGKFGKAAREDVMEHHSATRMVRRYADLYQQVRSK